MRKVLKNPRKSQRLAEIRANKLIRIWKSTIVRKMRISMRRKQKVAKIKTLVVRKDLELKMMMRIWSMKRLMKMRLKK